MFASRPPPGLVPTHDGFTWTVDLAPHPATMMIGLIAGFLLGVALIPVLLIALIVLSVAWNDPSIANSLGTWLFAPPVVTGPVGAWAGVRLEAWRSQTVVRLRGRLLDVVTMGRGIAQAHLREVDVDPARRCLQVDHRRFVLADTERADLEWLAAELGRLTQEDGAQADVPERLRALAEESR